MKIFVRIIYNYRTDNQLFYMRGGKLTQHGAKEKGLGGTSFQKGDQVSRQVMADSLDPIQPLMELTFSADPKNQQSKLSGSPHSPSQVPRFPSPQRSNGFPGSHARQQTVLVGHGSPHLKKQSEMRKSGELQQQPAINIDLQKLGSKRHLQAFPSGNLGTDLTTPPLDPKKGHELQFLEQRMSSTVDEETARGSQMSLKAILLQNVPAAADMPSKSNSRQSQQQSLHGSEATFQGAFTAVMVEDGRLDPRPVETQARGDLTPRDRGIEPSDLTSTPSQYLDRSPVKRAAALASSRATSKDQTGITQESARRALEKQSLKKTSPQGQVAKMQVFDINVIQESARAKVLFAEQAKKIIGPLAGLVSGPTKKVKVSPERKPQGPLAGGRPLQGRPLPFNTTASQASFSQVSPFGPGPGLARGGGFASNYSIEQYQGDQTPSQALLHYPSLSHQLAAGPEGGTEGPGLNRQSPHQQTFGANFGNSRSILVENSPKALKESPSKKTISDNDLMISRALQALGGVQYDKPNDSIDVMFGAAILEDEEFDYQRKVYRDPAQLMNVVQKIAYQSSVDTQRITSKLALQKDSLASMGEDLVESVSSGLASSHKSLAVTPINEETELHHGQPTSPHLLAEGISEVVTPRNEGTPSKIGTDKSVGGNERLSQAIDREGQQSPLDYQVSVQHRQSPDRDMELSEGRHDSKSELQIEGKNQAQQIAMDFNIMSESLRSVSKMLLNEPEGFKKREQERGNAGSLTSVTAAINQIEAYGLNPWLIDGNNSIQESGYMSPLDQYQDHSKSPKVRKPRVVMPLATVNIMSGAVTLEESTKALPTPVRVGAISPPQSKSPNRAMEAAIININQLSSVASPGTKASVGGLGRYNHMNMNQTTFVDGRGGRQFAPNVTFTQNNSLLSNAENQVKVNFRGTGQMPARRANHKNYMLRTTLGLRDEASSDTVSTEFNYLQPTVRRLELGERASVVTSQHGGVIHVQEHNLQSVVVPSESMQLSDALGPDARKDSILIQSGTTPTLQHITLDTGSGIAALRHKIRVNQDSSVIFDTPSKNIITTSSISGTNAGAVLIDRNNPPVVKAMRSQLSKARLAPLSISPSNGSIEVKLVKKDSPPPRAVSKLSVDLRDQAAWQQNEDIQGQLDREAGKTLRFQDQSRGRDQTPDQSPGLGAQESPGLRDAHAEILVNRSRPKFRYIEPTQNVTDTRNILKNQNSSDSDGQDATVKEQKLITIISKSVVDTLGLPVEEEEEVSGEKLLMQDAAIQQSGSVLLQGASSVDDIGRATKDIILKSNVSPQQPSGLKKSTSRTSGKVLNETASFRPTELKLFEPDLALRPSQESAIGSAASPRTRAAGSPLRHVASQSVTKGLKKQVLARDASHLRTQVGPLVFAKTHMRQVGTQMDSPRSPGMKISDTVATIDVKDKRLQQPSMLTRSSRDVDGEEKHFQEPKRGTTQSFATVRHSNDSPNGMDNFQESKMSRFMPAVFSTTFSQTYVDLLKNVRPYDGPSDGTESDQQSTYPSPVFRKGADRTQIGTQMERHPLMVTERTFKSSVGQSTDRAREKQLAENPELKFYLQVLERMRRTHKDVVSVAAVQEIQKNYKKYLATGSDAGAGLFGDLQSQKMDKPLITLSNDDGHDPLSLKFKTERSLYKQYNIAAITAQGVDNLPKRWKQLSPINRLKAKLKADAANKRYANQPEKPSRAAVSQSVNLIRVDEPRERHAEPESTRNLFKSLISSQEFDLEARRQQSVDADAEFQALFGDLKRDGREVAQSKVESAMPSALRLGGQVSASLDLANRSITGELRLAQGKASKSRTNRGAVALSMQGSMVPRSPYNGLGAFAAQSPLSKEILTNARHLINEDSTQKFLDCTLTARLAHSVVAPASTTRTRVPGSPQPGRQLALASVTDSVESKDPAANPTNPRAVLALQKSQFADLLSFGKGKVDLKGRVGASGQNPFRDEIGERLRDPQGRAVLLEKSLVSRADPKLKELLDQWKPKVRQDKTIKIATRDIYDSVRVQRGIPPVPLHRMDTISRNLTESLIEENAAERIPMREWEKQEVMLPILNTAKRNITLHTSADLSVADIQRQRKVALKTGRQPPRKVLRSLDPPGAEETRRAGTRLSKMSASSPDRITMFGHSSKMAISPAPAASGPFNNPMLREATEMNQFDDPMLITVSARRRNHCDQ